MPIAGATYRDGVAFIDGALCVRPTGDASITGGTIALDNGSAGSPSLQWASDNDGSGTGFYRYTIDQTGVACAGTAVMRFTAAGLISTFPVGFESTFGNGADTAIARAAANSLRFGGSLTATTTSRTEINKAVTGISNAAATATFTVTVPNAAHSAMLKVTLVGSLGAGGAVGANEATGTISYDFAITRTAGVATVVGVSSAYGSATSAVSGAATITITAAASAISGAVGATQTFTVNVTISRGSGSSDNHTCLVYGRLLNANATGITIA